MSVVLSANVCLSSFKRRIASVQCCLPMPIIPNVLCNRNSGASGFNPRNPHRVNSFSLRRYFATKSSKVLHWDVDGGPASFHIPWAVSLFHVTYVPHSTSHMGCSRDLTPSGFRMVSVRIQLWHLYVALVGLLWGWNFCVHTNEPGPQVLHWGGGSDQGARRGMDGA